MSKYIIDHPPNSTTYRKTHPTMRIAYYIYYIIPQYYYTYFMHHSICIRMFYLLNF